MNWLDALLSNLRSLWPWWWIRTGQQGVLYKAGKATKVLNPGIYFAFWWRNRIEIESVAVDTLNLPAFTAIAADGVEFTYSINFVYRIRDLLKKQTKVTDFNSSIENLASIHATREMRSRTSQDVLSQQELIEKSIRKTANRFAKAWGVQLLEAGITDLTRKAQVLRHMGDIVISASQEISAKASDR